MTNFKASENFTYGSEIINTSLLHPFYCLDIAIIDEFLKHPKILITSRNGVIGLLENLKNFELQDNDFKNKEILTVGSKTFDFLIQNGFKNLREASIDITTLKKNHQLDGVLYLSGFHTAFHDYKIYGMKKVVVYKTIPMPLEKSLVTQIKLNKISYVLLYSKRNAEAFLENFSEDYDFKNIRFICISENVAKVLESRAKNVIFPCIPTKEEMLKLIEKGQK
jgi:uroporphyrinogen-III synthase